MDGHLNGNFESAKTGGNPIFPGWYADPEVCILDGKYWVFPTVSHAFGGQTYLDAFSSPDLVQWIRHPRILDSTGVHWLRKALWAPVAFAHRGRYWLIFSANDIQVPESPWWKPEMADEPQDGGLGIAVADRPEGPYRDALGHPLVSEVWNGAQPIDACIFRYDGALWIAYGGWGRCNLARLRDDLSGLEPFADGTQVREVTPPGYVEGPFLFERAGGWYFLWSEGDWTNDSYRVACGRAPTPFGPWKRERVILESDPSVATGAGHCAVLQVPGDDAATCLLYHRRPIPNEGRDHRVVCIERMEFSPAGDILPVRLTDEGVCARPLPATAR